MAPSLQLYPIRVDVVVSPPSSSSSFASGGGGGGSNSTNQQPQQPPSAAAAAPVPSSGDPTTTPPLPPPPPLFLRIVDTLLLDLSAPRPSTEDMAYQIVADAVVQGVSRGTGGGGGGGACSFPGRLADVDWTAAARQVQHEMLEPQLRAARDHYHNHHHPRLSQCGGGGAVGRKRPRVEIRLGATSTNADGGGGGGGALATATANAAGVARRRHDLVPIRLRLSVHGVRLHDDFLWDPHLDTMTPLAMAAAIGADLNLSRDAEVAVAVDIAEQVAAAGVAATVPPAAVVDGAEATEADDGGPATPRHNLTAAWTLPAAVHVTNVAHLVAHHRPVK